MDATACACCGDAIEPGDDVVRARVSTGFGPHNVEIQRFESPECRARWRGEDPVIAMTQQKTLDAFTGGVTDHAQEVAWRL